MTISSRTPEGSPNRCPVCQANIVIEPSRPLGDAPCPKCGALLWFVVVHSEPRFFDSADIELVDRLAERLKVDPEALRAGRWEELGVDSLDLVEAALELEGE